MERNGKLRGTLTRTGTESWGEPAGGQAELVRAKEQTPLPLQSTKTRAGSR